MAAVIFNRKIEVIFSKEDTLILDGQSRICNWLYNHLLERTIDDYTANNNEQKLLRGRNLRNQVPQLKNNYPFLKSVHSSPLKNTAIRLKETYERFFKLGLGYPKFKSWSRNWFSLFYDEPNKGFKLMDNNQLQISLGETADKRRLRVRGTLKEGLYLKEGDIIRNFRLCKQQGKKFFCIFCIERVEPAKKEVKTWIALDPNHKNLFVGIDHKGVSYEFEKITQLKYWDNVIDELKSKRDFCQRKAKLVTNTEGKSYYLPSKKWARLNKALNNTYHTRREQIKSACYSIANWIAKNYDYAAMGDYVPDLNTASCDNMHRSMLNQEVIGEFRNILKWVMKRSGKSFSMVDERNTTKKCCICGHEEKKGPNIREFICPKCNRTLHRDINSGVNIAKKDNILSGSDYVAWELSHTTYTAKWDFRKTKILFSGYAAGKTAV